MRYLFAQQLLSNPKTVNKGITPKNKGLINPVKLNIKIARLLLPLKKKVENNKNKPMDTYQYIEPSVTDMLKYKYSE